MPVKRTWTDSITEKMYSYDCGFDSANPSDKTNYTMFARIGKNHQMKEYLKMLYGVYTIPCIKNVIFNDPATIVFWEDGTKTVVKVMEGDEFDPYTGLAQAICKKALGDDYRNVFKKWTNPYYKKKADEEIEDLEEKTRILDMQTAFDEAVSTVMKNLSKDSY